ncbi:MAG TPA: GAP family protein [Solirubrobacter sp.]|nr:GAP family protein [Solirubrobacter sp.]
MGGALGQAISLAVGVTISPVPIVAVVVMLGTSRARTNAPALVLGVAAGLALIGAVLLALADGIEASEGAEPQAWVGWVQLALGAALVVAAVRKWRGRPRHGEAELPAWVDSIERFTLARSAAVGVAATVLNPKNLLLAAGAAAAIAGEGLGAGQEAIAMGVFVLVGTLGPGIPVVMFVVLGERAARPLGELREWLTNNSTAILAVLMLVIGAKLFGDGLGVVG